MKLTLIRKYKKPDYTIGLLYINGVFFCNTIEDTDRGLSDKMKLSDIEKIKIDGKTAIPTGSYEITLDVVSPKFSTYSFYKETCNGKVPRLLNVKGFKGILIHVADGYRGAELVQGCIGIGLNKIKGGLLEGKEYFKRLYSTLLEAYNNKEKIFIIIE